MISLPYCLTECLLFNKKEETGEHSFKYLTSLTLVFTLIRA